MLLIFTLKGRNNESDWKINDATLSRCHSVLKWELGGLYLEDYSSKYGKLNIIKNN